MNICVIFLQNLPFKGQNGKRYVKTVRLMGTLFALTQGFLSSPTRGVCERITCLRQGAGAPAKRVMRWMRVESNIPNKHLIRRPSGATFPSGGRLGARP